MVGMYKEGDPWWDVVLPFGFVLMGFFGWPRAIQITQFEIRQRGSLFALRRIAYGEIESVFCGALGSEAVVFGKNGVRIVHTVMHSDRERFVEQVKSIERKEVIIVGAIN